MRGCGPLPMTPATRIPTQAAILLLAVASGASGAAQAACKLLKVGDIPVTLRGVPVAPVALDGHPAQLIVDTGAYSSLLWREAVAAFNIRRLGLSGGRVAGAGGTDQTELVSVRDFALEDYVVHDLRFLAVSGAGAQQFAAGSVAGLLGEDFLSSMDVEFDLAAGRVRLFQPQGCNGDQVVYWAPAYFMVELAAAPSGTRWLQAHVSLNGRDVVAVFDTGASVSTVMTHAARRAGIAADGPGQAMHGVGPQSVQMSVARFSALTIGQETIRNPFLAIADVFGAQREVQLGSYIKRSSFTEPDMILGADFFAAHRIYIARSQGRMYFTYLGSPLFQPPAAAASPGPASDPGGQR